jgi:hypothetical protein
MLEQIQKHPKIPKQPKNLEQKGWSFVEQSICFLMKKGILSVREMILSKTKDDRFKALKNYYHIKKKILNKYLKYVRITCYR